MNESCKESIIIFKVKDATDTYACMKKVLDSMDDLKLGSDSVVAIKPNHGSTYLDSPVAECCICLLEYPESKIGVGTMSWLASVTMGNTNIHGTVKTVHISQNLFLR